MRQAETVTFGGSDLDRAAELRGDPAALAALWDRADARVLPLWRGKPLFRGETLGWLATDAVDAERPRVVLGREADGAGRFTVDLSDWTPETPEPETLGAFHDPSTQRHPDLPDDTAFAELRAAAPRLTPREAELAATAKGLLAWHAGHGYCPNCGAATAPAEGGWQRHCPDCGRRHFPRTDPVVIMLITRGNATLVGRAPNWPEGLYSCLAGFVEPGETLEAAVRREVAEEVGVRVGRVGYLASQPWPFPASLMIGCHGVAETTEIRTDGVEIADARWVTREEMMAAMAGDDPSLVPARPGAIARSLIERWLADRVPA